jgi:hypothetical protein
MKSNKKEKLQTKLNILQLKLSELKSTLNPDILTYNKFTNQQKEIRVLENESHQLQFVLNYGFVNYFNIEIGKKYKYFNSFENVDTTIIIHSIEQIYDSYVDSNMFTSYKIIYTHTEDNLQTWNVLNESSYGWLYEIDGGKISLEEIEDENR